MNNITLEERTAIMENNEQNQLDNQGQNPVTSIQPPQNQDIGVLASPQQNEGANIVTNKTDIYTNFQQKADQTSTIGNDSQLAIDDPDSSNKKSYKALIRLGMIIVAIVLVILGYYFPYKNYLRSEAVKKIVPTAPDPNWKKYSSKDESFSYQVPADFLKMDLAAFAAAISGNKSLGNEDSLTFYSADKSVEIYLSEIKNSSDYNQIINSYKSKKIKYAQGETTVSGKNAKIICQAKFLNISSENDENSGEYCSVYQVNGNNSYAFMLMINKQVDLSKGIKYFNKFLGSIQYSN